MSVSLTGSFTATGQSSAVRVGCGNFSLSIWGTFDGTVRLERSPDDTNYAPASPDVTAPNSYQGVEPTRGGSDLSGTLYRVNCTAFTSGEIYYQLLQDLSS